MGELIVLAYRRAERDRALSTEPATFHFDLACPFSYLAAERIERVLGDIRWVPVAGSALNARPDGWASRPSVRAHAETCAVALRLPLVWPDAIPTGVSGALRTAAYATEVGAGARFALAASRLAFCGGFDLDDPEILAEAAAAAAIPLREALSAAGDTSYDELLADAARTLEDRGLDRLPVIQVGERFFQGDSAIAQASALMRARSAGEFGRPLAPAS